jgi:ATP phosphoribosyltransferase
MENPLTLALPKGRLFDQVQEYFQKIGLDFTFKDRKLVAHDSTGSLQIFLVINSDLPTYVNHGIAGLGICGEDVIYESGYSFYKLSTLPFGSTRMCIAGLSENKNTIKGYSHMKVATKFTRFTRDYFHSKNVPVEIIKLNGSVELAAVLGLSPYIVDLVETGNTLKANDLAIFEVIKQIQVHLIANPAYFKLHYKRIKKLVDVVGEAADDEKPSH